MTGRAIVVDEPVLRGDTVTGLVRFDPGKVHVLHFTVPDHPPAAGPEAFVSAALLPAMLLGRPLRSEIPVSGRLLDGLELLQARFARWYPSLQVVPVEADRSGPPAGGPPRPVAAFFSAGVDSLHLALTRRDELDALVFVASYHTPRGLPPAIDHVRDGVRAAATALGLPLVEVSSNIRQFTELFLNWEIAHGAALAAVAHALSSRFGRVHAGSSLDPDEDHAWGSHPEVDHLWSGDDVTLVHDFAELSRAEKIAVLLERPDLARYLQVCWQHHRTTYNCGRCEKCLRLAWELRWAGMAGLCPDLPVHPSRLAYARLDHPTLEDDFPQTAKSARAHGDRLLEVAIGTRLAGRRARRSLRRVLGRS